MKYNRPMSKRVVAQLYYPDDNPRTALNKFHDEIMHSPSLLNALLSAGYDPSGRCWTFTPRQLRIIRRHLGDP